MYRSECVGRAAPMPFAVGTADASAIAASGDQGKTARRPDPNEKKAKPLPQPTPVVDPSPLTGPSLPEYVPPTRREQDRDGDGWLDEASNERWVLYLESVRALNPQEDSGEDEIYLLADDIRYPHDDLDGFWTFESRQQRDLHVPISSRVKIPGAPTPMAPVHVELWDDDFEVFNTWSADDHLLSFDFDFTKLRDGEVIERLEWNSDGVVYQVKFLVKKEYFADPTPGENAKSAGDGIREGDKYWLSAHMGGIADPARKELFVKIDWMQGHPLNTQAKRQVATRLKQHGIHAFLWRGEEIPSRPCTSEVAANQIYKEHFKPKNLKGFRYALIAGKIWNERSGVASSDMFLMDDSTWWINGMVLPQAGTFIHELGHTMGLTKELFELIDSTSSPRYESAMNYLYQPVLVDYSSESGSDDHDDWSALDLEYGIRHRFDQFARDELGVCAE